MAKHTIEQKSEAYATVTMKIVSGIFGIFGAIIKGVFKGLGFLPIFSGIKKAVNAELNK